MINCTPVITGPFSLIRTNLFKLWACSVSLYPEIQQKTVFLVKDQDLNKVKMFAIQNKELINVIKFEKEKVHQVEEELRQLLMERQADKEAMKQKLENFTKHLLNK